MYSIPQRAHSMRQSDLKTKPGYTNLNVYSHAHTHTHTHTHTYARSSAHKYARTHILTQLQFSRIHAAKYGFHGRNSNVNEMIKATPSPSTKEQRMSQRLTILVAIRPPLDLEVQANKDTYS